MQTRRSSAVRISIPQMCDVRPRWIGRATPVTTPSNVSPTRLSSSSAAAVRTAQEGANGLLMTSSQLFAGPDFGTPLFVAEAAEHLPANSRIPACACESLVARELAGENALSSIIVQDNAAAWSPNVRANRQRTADRSVARDVKGTQLGVASDELVRHGGTSVLAETPEIYGAENLLLSRAASPAVGQKLLDLLAWWEAYAAHNHETLDSWVGSTLDAGRRGVG